MKLERLKASKNLSKAKIITLDTETKDGLNGCDFFCGSVGFVIRGGHVKTETFMNLYSLFDYCALNFYTENNKRNFIYIQNLSFELRFILNWAITRRFRWHCIESADIIQCTVILDNKKGHILVFRDAYPWLQSSQEKAEITYKIDEQYRKIDCNDLFEKPFNEWSDEDKNRVIEHNKNDVIALFLILKQIREILFDLTNLDFVNTLTLPSYAMRSFRVSMEEDIDNPFIFFNNKIRDRKILLYSEDFNLIRSTYFGGRTELFGNPPLDEVCCKLDVNSEYPWAMYTQEYPCGNFFEIRNPTVKDLYDSSVKNLKGFVDVTVDCPSMKYPILPYRYDGKLLFPVGIFFRTRVTTDELLYALENGYTIHKIHKLIYFRETFNPFRDYVKKFYDLKSKSEGGKRQLCKMLLNSLSGKFGQKIERKYTDFEYITPDMDIYEELEKNDGKDIYIVNIDGVQFKKTVSDGVSLNAYNMPWLISYITSYSRIYLHKLIKKVGVVYYCDTDSLVIPANRIDLIREYLDENEIGGLKIEGTGYFYGWAPKCYVFRDINEGKDDIKVKGIPKRLVKKVSLNDDFSFAVTELEEFLRRGVDYEQYCKYKTAIRSGNTLVSGSFSKKMVLEDKKRNWLNNHESEPVKVINDCIPGWKHDEIETIPKVKVKNYKTEARKRREFEEKITEYFPDIDNSLALFDNSLEVEENIAVAKNDLINLWKHVS